MNPRWPKRVTCRIGSPRAAAGLVAAGLLVIGCGQPIDKLPNLGASIEQTSVSGISSGAYMAGQFQIAHSRLVVGAAIIGGGPYGCAENLFADLMPGPGTQFLNMSKAISGCMLNALAMWGVPNPRLLADKARRLAAEQRIDPLDGVAADRVYLFSGTQDRTVVGPVVAAAAEFYRQIGVPAGQVAHVTTIAAGHGFVTEDKGEACDHSGAPYIVACRYDQAGAVLAHIYGPLAARSAQPAGVFREFDQGEFTRDLGIHGLAARGVVYTPDSCRRAAGCRVHVAFHGCAQSRAVVGDAFVRESGFAAWADNNRLIVLFPQIASAPENPQGCWDWWGYTGREFMTRKAPQIIAVRRMLERLAGRVIGGRAMPRDRHATISRVGRPRAQG